ncbi:FadR/GntR family transcriptional regulator [Novosphingobium sp. EMRT-2]|uniref:FadR/GntR family transcriptional regulator n=1 Tax=Novosphingobium sp. EMRT-2 TaxID=2571749 RepID=UPI0010BCF7B3|nr:FadR/GntR family transcriptional regulator [Novosphingobium sp. EMRT-2]QCI96022.1 FadR family transcriptional regulator [Novosphingobium sp. EMRT-2]
MTPYENGGKVTARIVETLGRAIVAGEYADRPLPIEADISEQFKASRSVTREAIKMLTAKGLIASRPRLGTRVAPERDWNFLDPDVLRWLLSRGLSLDLLAEFTAFRSAIEPQAASLAIRRNDPEAITRIGEAAERMTTRGISQEDALQADIDFHVAILLASGNRFMIQCRDLVETALRFSIRLTNRQKGVATADSDAHRTIANAIAAGDAERAVSASRDLLNEAAALIEQARRAG